MSGEPKRRIIKQPKLLNGRMWKNVGQAKLLRCQTRRQRRQRRLQLQRRRPRSDSGRSGSVTVFSFGGQTVSRGREAANGRR